MKGASRRQTEPAAPRAAAAPRGRARSRRPAGGPGAQPGTLSSLDPASPIRRYTDLTNGRLLAERYGDRLRYVGDRKRWYVWDDRESVDPHGGRWVPDEKLKVEQFAKEMVETLLREAAMVPDPEVAAALVDLAQKCESWPRLQSMLKTARSEQRLVVTSNEFDTDPWLLNVRNGTLDLRTGELRPASPGDLITKLTPVAYDPHASHPAWERFLRDVTGGNERWGAFLQRAAGLCLTGDTSHETFFLLLGPTATGKTTFLMALYAALGTGYGAVVSSETLLRHSQVGRPRSDLARLQGKRLVVASEVDRDRPLSEATIKSITGGEPIVARSLFENEREFMPQFKLWLACNEAPRMPYDDDALWRRVVCLPFEHSVPEPQRNAALKTLLQDPHQGAPAVLAWMVEGYRAWQRDGLDVPPEVREATRRLQESMDLDPLGPFLRACCTLAPEQRAFSRDLYAAYLQFTWFTGGKPVAQNKFGMLLHRRDCEPFNTGQAHGWRGIGLNRVNQKSP